MRGNLTTQSYPPEQGGLKLISNLTQKEKLVAIIPDRIETIIRVDGTELNESTKDPHGRIVIGKASNGGQISEDGFVDLQGQFGRYQTKVFLTKDQTQRLDLSQIGSKTYPVVLTRGNKKQSESARNSDWGYHANWYWNAYMFDGIISENPSAVPSGFAHNTDMPTNGGVTQQVAQSIQSNTSPAGKPEKDPAGWLFNTSNAVAAASNLKHKSLEEYKTAVREIAVFLYELQGAGYDATKALVDPSYVSDSPESNVNEDAEYTYPSAATVTSIEGFNEYVRSAGWATEDVTGWLDGAETLEQWLDLATYHTIAHAIAVCTDKALKIDLQPPANFREVKA